MRKIILISLLMATSALAQQAGSPFAGFSQNRNQPINFEADKAEVFDLEKKAILTGRVKVVQGESTLTAGRLVIWYEEKDPAAKKEAAATGSPANSQTVKQFDMEGGVLVSSKSQVATAMRGTYNARTDKAVMYDNVVLTQCANIMKGERLDVNIKTNEAKLSGSAQNGRVSGLLTQGSQAQANGECAEGQNPAQAKTTPLKRTPITLSPPAKKTN